MIQSLATHTTPAASDPCGEPNRSRRTGGLLEQWQASAGHSSAVQPAGDRSVFNSTGKAWIVTSQFMENGSRFDSKSLALHFAKTMAAQKPTCVYEIFECVAVACFEPEVTVTERQS